MYGIIYKTVYLPTGEWYVGKHKCDSEEFDGYLGSGKIITEMRKTKSSSLFKRTTLAIAENKEDLTNLEIFYIEAGNKTKICTANILAVCSGRRKIAGGFHWRYAEDGGDQ